MSFDDRLRNHLHGQADQVTIEPFDSSGPATRAARRQTRRRVAVAAVFVAVIGFSAAWVGSRDGGEPSVATAVTADIDDSSADDSAPEVDDSSAESIADSSPTATAPAPLRFDPVDAAGAPGGLNIFTRGTSGDLYYVLSTAPGVDDESFEAPWRNDTLYTWSGSDWSNATFTDRFVTTIDARDGVLYTVSTGSATGDGPAVGISDDAGSSWDWVPLDLPADLGLRPALATAHNGDSHLALAWKAPVADWDEAFELARSAGFEIDWETHNVISVDTTGIRYAPQSEADACYERYWTATDEAVTYPEELFDETIWDDDGPTEEELARFNEVQATYEAEYAAAQLQVLEGLATEPACAAFAACTTAQVVWNQERTEMTTEIYVELGVIEPGESSYSIDWSALDEATLDAVDEATNALWDAPGNPYDDETCNQVLGYEGQIDENAETVTWESLGVEPPASWDGAIAAFAIEGGAARSIDVPFAPGFLQAITATDDGFVVDLVNDDTTTTRWVGDERGWEASVLPSGQWSAATGADGTEYRIDWEADALWLERTDGQTASIPSSAIFGETYDASGIMSVDTGAYGVVVTTLDFTGERSLVAYSPDGTAWAVTELDDTWVDGVIVSESDVMVFAHRFGETGTTDVLIGRS